MQRRMDGNPGRVWITWETQRRNSSLAAAFEARYLPLDFSDRLRPLRYLSSAFHTCREIFSNHPKMVFAQCPSLVLCVLLCAIRRFIPFRLIVDAHNVAIEHLSSPNFFFRLFARYVARSSDFVIVSNEPLCAPVLGAGGRPLVLPDPLPVIPVQTLPARFQALAHPFVTVISTFASDEPIETFLEAAAHLQKKVTYLITGRKSKAGAVLRFAAPNIIFTDFLPAEEYDGLIANSDLLVDLTTRENCLVCGAYEAVAVGVPGLLSDSAALRSVFRRGFLFAGNTVKGYREALEAFFREPAAYKAESAHFRQEFLAYWQSLFAAASAQLSHAEH